MSHENNISPDIDCPSCGGEGLDADPYGRFDYDCIIACPDCHTSQPTQSDALREALVDLLYAVCGKTGFAETVRRDSGRIYPWPALDLAEAKALEALERSK